MPEEQQEQQEPAVNLTESDLQVINEINETREAEPEIQPEPAEETFSEEDSASLGEDDSAELPEQQQPDAASEARTDEIDYDLRVRASRYGLVPEHFRNAESLRDTVSYFDQQVQQQQQQAQQQQPEPGQQQAQQPAERPEFKLDLGEEYDEGLVKAVNKALGDVSQYYHDQMELLAGHVLQQQQFISAQQQQAQMAQAQQYLDEFDQAIEGLNQPELFGKGSSNKLTGKPLESRQKLYDQALTLASGYTSRGQQAPPLKELVQGAYRVAYGNEFEKNARRKLNDRLRKQSQRRMGSGTTTNRVQPPSDDPVDNPVLREAWEAYQRENGAM